MPKKNTAPETSRHCKSCKTSLPIEQFEVYRKGGIRWVCNKCKYQQRRDNDAKSPESYLTRLAVRLKSSRRKTHDWRLTPEDLHEIWYRQEGRCALSGVHLTHHIDGRGVKEFNASVDRINNDIHYEPQNIQLVAYRVNIMRHTLSEDMFWWWIKTIHDNFYEKQTKAAKTID